MLARLIGQWLSERLGQPVIVENRPGAGGNIAHRGGREGGAGRLHAAPGRLDERDQRDALRQTQFQFPPRHRAGRGIIRAPNVMEVNPSFPVKTVAEFIAYAKANPGKINMASAGIGTSPHVSGELFKMMTGVDMVHVPYRGGAPALTDLIGGQVQVMFDNLSSSIEHIRAGKLRALAVTTATRSEALPDVPTVGDFVPGYEASCWPTASACRRARPPRSSSKLNTRDQRGPRRSQDQGAARRPGRHRACGLACRLREADRRRNREVGEGGQVLRRQGGLIAGRPTSVAEFINQSYGSDHTRDRQLATSRLRADHHGQWRATRPKALFDRDHAPAQRGADSARHPGLRRQACGCDHRI